MTIDEAIEQYKYIAVSYEKCGNTEDAMVPRQIAEWLRQARGADAASRWYSAKLRDANRYMRKVMAENAKLRELVRDMWQFTGAACKKYPRLFDPSAQGGQMVKPNMIDAFEQRMRELGIEVSNGQKGQTQGEAAH